MDYKKLKLELVHWLKNKVSDAKCKGVVFGLSGGVDSAVVAALSKEAFEDKALAIMMPIESDPQDRIDAMKVIRHFDLTYEEVDMTDLYDRYKKIIEPEKHKPALANIKPRLRMMTLYYYAQNRKSLVLSGSNYSEFMIGYFTKYGDSGADLMPLGELSKREVYFLAEELGIPQDIIHKKPSAGLWESQTDEQELGFTYEELDRYLIDHIPGPNKERIDKMINNSYHKRVYAKIFNLNRKKGYHVRT